MPKIVDKKMMVQKIISASLSVFREHGVNNSSMNHIAQEMGVAKGTLYRYFSSKDELMQAITEQHFDKLKSTLFPKQLYDTLEELLTHIEQTLLISEEDSVFIPIFFEVFGPSFSNPIFMRKYDNFFDDLGQYYAKNIRYLQSKGAIDMSNNPEALGRVLVSMLDGIILHKGFFNISSDNHTRMVLEAMTLFRRGLNN